MLTIVRAVLPQVMYGARVMHVLIFRGHGTTADVMLVRGKMGVKLDDPITYF